jgi:hypothetical protein
MKKENRERESVRKEKGEGRVKEKQNRGEKAVAVLVGQPFYTVIVVCNCKQQVPGTRASLSFFENRGREEDREIRNPQKKNISITTDFLFSSTSFQNQRKKLEKTGETKTVRRIGQPTQEHQPPLRLRHPLSPPNRHNTETRREPRADFRSSVSSQRNRGG